MNTKSLAKCADVNMHVASLYTWQDVTQIS